MKLTCHIMCQPGTENGKYDPAGIEMIVDHDEKFVIISFGDISDFCYASLSPAESKVLAAALVHYADRAQTVRDRQDEANDRLDD